MTRKVLCALAVLFFSTALVQANVPPSSYVVKQFAKHNQNFKTLSLRLVVSKVVAGSPTAVHFRENLLLDRNSGVLQSRAFDDENSELFARSRNLKSDDALRVSPLMALLFSDNEEHLFYHLGQQLIPLKSELDLTKLKTEAERREAEKHFVKRWQNRVVWGLGGDSKTETAPQIWFEKETFLPVRWVFPDSARLPSEVQFGPFKYETGYPFPSETRFFKSGEEKIFVTIEKMATNSKLAGFPAPLTDGFTEKGTALSGDLKELIETYYFYGR